MQIDGFVKQIRTNHPCGPLDINTDKQYREKRRIISIKDMLCYYVLSSCSSGEVSSFEKTQ